MEQRSLTIERRKPKRKISLSLERPKEFDNDVKDRECQTERMSVLSRTVTPNLSPRCKNKLNLSKCKQVAYKNLLPQNFSNQSLSNLNSNANMRISSYKVDFEKPRPKSARKQIKMKL